MFNPADLPERIPVFPLPGAILLPRGHLPLNIFEPRYLSMFEDALKTRSRLIGMVQPMSTPPRSDAQPQLHQIGCAGRIIAFAETEDGRYRITLAGISRFRIKSTEPGFSPYLRGFVDWSGFDRDLGKPEKDRKFDRAAFLKTLGRFFRSTGMESDWANLKKANDELLVNSLSMIFPFDSEDKQALLEAPSLGERRKTLVTLMEFSMASGNNEGKIQ